MRRNSQSRLSLAFDLMNKDPASIPGISIPKECRDSEKLSKVVYNKNLEYRNIGKDSPGPGVYN